jgi:hypothetical protein
MPRSTCRAGSVRGSVDPMTGKAALVLVLTTCCLASGCGEATPPEEPSLTAGRDVAQRFAEAIFQGKGDAAVALLLDADDRPLSSLATRAAAPWKVHHGVVRLRTMRSRTRWIFRYAATRTHGDGRFEQVRGDMLVVVAASSDRVGVRFFSLRNDRVRFSTHRDSVLLPSNR